ncbi:hypothetical protein AB0J63_38980 [Streptosporangium canum]|uniref:hypothetical protein n=1 Tax=Streptosporangium canum TaxID=324952 RepID=UPI003415838A
MLAADHLGLPPVGPAHRRARAGVDAEHVLGDQRLAQPVVGLLQQVADGGAGGLARECPPAARRRSAEASETTTRSRGSRVTFRPVSYLSPAAHEAMTVPAPVRRCPSPV